MTRLPYTENEIKEIDKLYRFYKLSNKYNANSISQLFKNEEYYKKLLYNNERIDVIRDEIFTILTRALEIIINFLKIPKDEEESFQDPEEPYFIPYNNLRIVEEESESEQVIVIYENVEDILPMDEEPHKLVLSRAVFKFQESFWLFMSLYPLSNHWFEATFKFAISRVEENKDPDKYDIKKKFIDFIKNLRLICINNNSN